MVSKFCELRFPREMRWERRTNIKGRGTSGPYTVSRRNPATVITQIPKSYRESGKIIEVRNRRTSVLLSIDPAYPVSMEARLAI